MLQLARDLFTGDINMDFRSLQSIQPREELAVISNLPPYPWDHSNTFWHEPCLSRGHRFRKFLHDLLGKRLPSSTPIDPIWTYIVDEESLPWLKDHIVNGLTIFPGSGYLCMVIEALHELHEYD